VTDISFLTNTRRGKGSHANVAPALAQTPHLRMCFDYWQSKCKWGRLPSRRDIDPAEMKGFLPSVILIEVERSGAGRRFRVRLMGTRLAEIFGQDVTGLYLDQICTPEARNVLTDVMDLKKPCYGVSRGLRPDRDFIEFEHLTLPLASNGERVDMLFGVRCRLDRRNLPPVEHEISPNGKTERASETNAAQILVHRRAEEMNQARSALLAKMSHELRTPLNAILGFSEIIRDQRLGKDLDRYTGFADDIHQSGARLLNIVNDLLNVSEIEPDWSSLNPAMHAGAPSPASNGLRKT